MLWYQALIPAAITAVVVRLDALFLGPYWSWLQLIPHPGEGTEREIVTKRKRALARRVSIPGVVAFVLQSLWPTTYTPARAALVGLLAAALLLWPLVFIRRWDEVRHPRLMVYALYALLLVIFGASSYIGGTFGLWITEGEGLIALVREEGTVFLLTAVVLLFATDTSRRVAETLRRRRDQRVEG